MPELIPFTTSKTNERLGVALGGVRYFFDVRWNSQDKAWYFDLLVEDLTPIAIGLKVVLGVNLGRRSANPFFKNRVLRVVDTSGTGFDAGYDDLGARIVLLHIDLSEFGIT